MDPLTQGIAGGIFAQCFSNRKTRIPATLAGVAGGMFADIDVIIRSNQDPLLALEFHRHFTHSLVFAPIGALIVSLFLFWLPYFRNRLGFRVFYGFAFAGYLTSGLLDACTSYGTRLFWPFSAERVAWNNIGIIDPLFTGVLLISLIAGLWTGRSRLAQIGTVFGFLYLGLGEVQNRRAEHIIANLAESRGHETISEVTAKPSPLSLLLWRGIYRYENTYYVDAIHLNYGSGHRIYEGSSIPKFDEVIDLKDNTTLSNDIARFRHFSDGYLYQIPNNPNRIGDLRYSLIPNSIDPLWAIQFDPDEPNQHVEYKTFRQINDDSWELFKAMMWGNDIPSASNED